MALDPHVCLKPLIAFLNKFNEDEITDQDMALSLHGKTGPLINPQHHFQPGTSDSTKSRHRVAQKNLLTIRNSFGDGIFYLCIFASAITPLSKSGLNGFKAALEVWRHKVDVPDKFITRAKAAVGTYLKQHNAYAESSSPRKRDRTATNEPRSAGNSPKRARTEEGGDLGLAENTRGAITDKEITTSTHTMAIGDVQSKEDNGKLLHSSPDLREDAVVAEAPREEPESLIHLQLTQSDQVDSNTGSEGVAGDVGDVTGKKVGAGNKAHLEGGNSNCIEDSDDESDGEADDTIRNAIGHTIGDTIGDAGGANELASQDLLSELQLTHDQGVELLPDLRVYLIEKAHLYEALAYYDGPVKLLYPLTGETPFILVNVTEKQAVKFWSSL